MLWLIKKHVSFKYELKVRYIDSTAFLNSLLVNCNWVRVEFEGKCEGQDIKTNKAYHLPCLNTFTNSPKW